MTIVKRGPFPASPLLYLLIYACQDIGHLFFWQHIKLEGRTTAVVAHHFQSYLQEVMRRGTFRGAVSGLGGGRWQGRVAAGDSLLKQDMNGLRPMIAHGSSVTGILSIKGETRHRSGIILLNNFCIVCLGHKTWLSTRCAMHHLCWFAKKEKKWMNKSSFLELPKGNEC